MCIRDSNMPRSFLAGKWKMRFYKPNGFRTPSDRFEYPFTYLNQDATTQTGYATSILAPDIRHSKKWQKWQKMMWKWSIQNSFRIGPRRFLDLQDIKKHSGEIQKTYSRTSKIVGYFELCVTCYDRLLRGSEKWDFTSRMDSGYLQIDLNILLHI